VRIKLNIMKITRGYTIEQFIDLIQKKKYQKYLKFHSDYNDFALTNLGLIYRFNEMCQQPLKKYMFNDYNGILKGWLQDDFKDELFYHKSHKLEYSLEFRQDGIFIYIYSHENVISKEIKTIGDLFQATNGELELQNIEL